MPRHWWGPFAVWDGGLGVWGGILAGAFAGIWRVRRAGADWRLMADAAAPALLVAQAVGRIGNYFNQELYGRPTSLPWALEISPAHRVAGYARYPAFQPSFLYELIFDLALAAALVWLGHHRDIRPPGLLALYVTGYSAYRILEEPSGSIPPPTSSGYGSTCTSPSPAPWPARPGSPPSSAANRGLSPRTPGCARLRRRPDPGLVT